MNVGGGRSGDRSVEVDAIEKGGIVLDSSRTLSETFRRPRDYVNKSNRH